MSRQCCNEAQCSARWAWGLHMLSLQQHGRPFSFDIEALLFDSLQIVRQGDGVSCN